MGPRQCKSTVLTSLEEAAIVAFRVQTRLPLDDVFCALKPSIPALAKHPAPLPSAPPGLEAPAARS